MLEKCSHQRSKEVAAMQEMALSIKEELNKKFDSLSRRIDLKVYEKCGKKFDSAEFHVMKVLRGELSFLASPGVFKHPPDGVEHSESGAKAFLQALSTATKKGNQIQSYKTTEPKVVAPISESNQEIKKNHSQIEKPSSEKVVESRSVDHKEVINENANSQIEKPSSEKVVESQSVDHKEGINQNANPTSSESQDHDGSLIKDDSKNNMLPPPLMIHRESLTTPLAMELAR